MSAGRQTASVRIVEFGLADAAWRERYDALFEQCPAAYLQQSSWWAEVIAPLGPDRPQFLLALIGDQAVAGFPLYLFSGPAGAVMTSVPQAGPLGGVFSRPELDEAARTACTRELIRAALEAAQREQCLAMAVIMDPFQAEDPAWQTDFAPDYRFGNFTQWIDLRTFFTPEGEVAFRDYNRRSNLSRNLAKAHAAGLKVRIGIADAELDRLYEIHLKRHAELDATPLDRRLIDNIAKVLVPRGKAFFTVVESADGRIASWAVHLHHHRVLDVLRLNLDSEFTEACPNFLNTDASLRHARALGITHYNWQSSPDRTSGVYRYKAQWSAVESSYRYLTRLFCPVSTLREIGLARLQREYPLHFIAPYAAATADFALGDYRKA